MKTFKRPAEICGLAFYGLLMAAVGCVQPAGEPRSAAPASETTGKEEYVPHCLEKTTLRIAGRDQVITVQEADRIRLVLERYLEEEKPDLEPSVLGPGKAFIDCWGTVRMGAWILEPAGTEQPELRLAHRIVTSENFIVRQIVDLAMVGGQWKATGVSVETAHRFY